MAPQKVDGRRRPARQDHQAPPDPVLQKYFERANSLEYRESAGCPTGYLAALYCRRSTLNRLEPE